MQQAKLEVHEHMTLRHIRVNALTTCYGYLWEEMKIVELVCVLHRWHATKQYKLSLLHAPQFI